MIKRETLKLLNDALDFTAATILVGSRQVGKTSVAKQICNQRGGLYMDLAQQRERNLLSEPVEFLERYEDRLVVLDEVSHRPKLFPEIRGVIDSGRSKGKGKGRFMLLGSAPIHLLRQSGESLAGRVRHVELKPLSVNEVYDERNAMQRLWLRGGFPESYLARTDKDSLLWRMDYSTDILIQDAKMFGDNISLNRMYRLMSMLANLHGSLLNSSNLARTMEVGTRSINRYIDLLCDLFVLRKLYPYRSNIGKRMVKSPKLYFRDSGILHSLLNIETLENLVWHNSIGMSWEGFVIENIIQALPHLCMPYFYRTAKGAEIDLVLEFPDRSIWAIEIKRTGNDKLRKGFYFAKEDIKPARTFVVYAGTQEYPMQDGIEVIGLHGFLKQLQSICNSDTLPLLDA